MWRGIGALAIAGILLAAGPVTAASPQPRATAVACTVKGAKVLAPLDEAAICARFVRALGAASRSRFVAASAAPADGLVVELRFTSQGLASAQVTRRRGGHAQALPLYELVVNDRKFAAGDLDKLAAHVAREMTGDAAAAGRG